MKKIFLIYGHYNDQSFNAAIRDTFIKTAKIKTALILCAGFGKRLNPLTLTTPKPLLELNNVTILEKNINLIKKLGINKIFINTFYLKKHFLNYLKIKNFEIDIDVV